MPCAGHVEKEGHFTNTQRLLQWRDKAIDPPGDARSELHFIYHLGRRVKAHYAASERERDWPIRNLTWDYPEHGPHREPSAEDVLREINGRDLENGRLLDGFAQLKADGTTACGCWIYSGCFAGGVNQTRRRDAGDLSAPGGWVSPEWGWAWPANRRILYNRASADPEGRPWSERKRYVWWDEAQERWTGYDVPDFPVGKRPDYEAPPEALGMDAISGDGPFIMMPDGRAALYSPSGLLDAPLPTHYEPLESPVRNELYPNVGSNPVSVTWRRPENPLIEPEDTRYPHVASTFRLTEHHTAGPMSRNLPWLAELQPEMFAEIDPVLAASRNIVDGGWMVIETERAEIEARAKVTNRVRPLQVGGRTVHQVCLPWHFGTYRTNEQGVTGDAVNDLVAMSGDPNVSIHESKAFRCEVRAGRRSGETTERLQDAAAPSPPDAAADEDHPAERPTRAAQTEQSVFRYGGENREI
jgi:formate dehydrogenase major subunit